MKYIMYNLFGNKVHHSTFLFMILLKNIVIQKIKIICWQFIWHVWDDSSYKNLSKKEIFKLKKVFKIKTEFNLETY